MKENFTKNDSKYHSASKYLNNLNQVQSHMSVKIKKLRRVTESSPVCLAFTTLQMKRMRHFQIRIPSSAIVLYSLVELVKFPDAFRYNMYVTYS